MLMLSSTLVGQPNEFRRSSAANQGAAPPTSPPPHPAPHPPSLQAPHPHPLRAIIQNFKTLALNHCSPPVGLRTPGRVAAVKTSLQPWVYNHPGGEGCDRVLVVMACIGMSMNQIGLPHK